MPKLKIDHILSFSSEDPVHVANNLLSGDPAKKWKCQNAGEKQATVVLQLEKASVISSIDIGNENSAYVEVLASRSATGDDYKVLLVMSSFMTPMEARQTININKVRMFTHDQLSKPECDQKWLRLKIVCTQPFNRHTQYGLSFVNFYTPEEKTNATPVQTTIGKFAIRPKSPDVLGAGSLFARRKELQKQEPLKGAAAIRNASSASSLSNTGTPICKPKLKQSNITPSSGINLDDDSKPLARNRNELLYSKDEEAPNEKIDKIVQKKQEEDKAKRENDDTPKRPKKENATTPKVSGESSKRKTKHKTDREAKKIKIVKQQRPFSQLMKDVTLVISGIANPDRGNLRTMGLQMGAKYKADWDNSCTHLICAFQNTPKFQQVKGKGKIVKRSWLEECHSQRKRLPWRRFALDKNDASKAESEDEIEEEKAEQVDFLQDSSDDAMDEGFDDTKMQDQIAQILAKNNGANMSVSDDDDEPKSSVKTKQQTDDAIYLCDTEDEDDCQSLNSTKDIPKQLPDFFNNKTFFIDEVLDEDICKLLERYIIAYKGTVSDNSGDNVDFVIGSEDSVSYMRDLNPNATFVKPDWICECHHTQSFVPVDAYKV